jgi:hypothetical protein
MAKIRFDPPLSLWSQKRLLWLREATSPEASFIVDFWILPMTVELGNSGQLWAAARPGAGAPATTVSDAASKNAIAPMRVLRFGEVLIWGLLVAFKIRFLRV